MNTLSINQVEHLKQQSMQTLNEVLAGPTKITHLNGLTWLPEYAYITVSGIDAVKLLQGLFTNDIQTINTHHGQLNGLCNIKGRLKALLWVIREDNDTPTFNLVGPANNMDNIIKFFAKYAMFSKVDISKTAKQDKTFFIAFNDAANALKNFNFHSFLQENTACALIDNGNIETLLNMKPNIIAPNVWHYYCIMQHIPEITEHNVNQFLPHHLNLHNLNAINFKKGCYLGQEIIARMHYRGKIKKHCHAAQIQGPTKAPLTGLAVCAQDNHIAGHIVRTLNTDTMTLLLICLDDAAEQGSSFYLENDIHTQIKLLVDHTSD